MPCKIPRVHEEIFFRDALNALRNNKMRDTKAIRAARRGKKMPSGIRKYLRPDHWRSSGSDTLPAAGTKIPAPIIETEASRTLRGQTDGREGMMTRESVRNLAHELRSPLTAIKSSLQLVAEGEAGPVTDDQEHFLALALRNLDRLDRMTTDLLDRERGEMRGKSLMPRRIDLGKTLREGVQLHALAAKRAGLDFDADGLPESYVAEIDPDRIMQIVDNLLGNALKFTSPPGLVHIWLDQNTALPQGLEQDLVSRFMLPLDMFTLVIEDSGRGIAHDRQARLFEAFTRAHDESRVKVPGSGLGLHITRDLVGAMGGTLSLASNPGQGTTLWVRMPRDEMTRHCLLQLAAFQAKVKVPGPVQVAVLDLRQRSRVPGAKALSGFLATMEDQGLGVGTEVVKGLWVAAIFDAKGWSRSWSRFTFRAGSGALEAPWRKLGPERVVEPSLVAELI